MFKLESKIDKRINDFRSKGIERSQLFLLLEHKKTKRQSLKLLLPEKRGGCSSNPHISAEIITRELIKAEHINKQFLAIVKVSTNYRHFWNYYYDGIAPRHHPDILFIVNNMNNTWFGHKYHLAHQVRVQII
jgi:hypothetical protein